MDSVLEHNEVSQNMQGNKESRLELFKLQMTMRRSMLLKDQSSLKQAYDRAIELGMEEKDGLLEKAKKVLSMGPVAENNKEELKHPALDRPIISKQNRMPKSVKKDSNDKSARTFIGNVFDLSKVIGDSPKDQNQKKEETPKNNLNDFIEEEPLFENFMAVEEQFVPQSSKEEEIQPHSQINDLESESSEEEILPVQPETLLNEISAVVANDMPLLMEDSEFNVPVLIQPEDMLKQKDQSSPFQDLHKDTEQFKTIFVPLKKTLLDLFQRTLALNTLVSHFHQFLQNQYHCASQFIENQKKLQKSLEPLSGSLEMEKLWITLESLHSSNLKESTALLDAFHQNAISPLDLVLGKSKDRMQALLEDAIGIEHSVSSALEEAMAIHHDRNAFLEAASEFHFWSAEFTQRVPEVIQQVQSLTQKRLATVQNAFKAFVHWKQNTSSQLTKQEKALTSQSETFNPSKDILSIEETVFPSKPIPSNTLSETNLKKCFVINRWGSPVCLTQIHASYKSMGEALENWANALDVLQKPLQQAHTTFLEISAFPAAFWSPTEAKGWQTASVLVTREMSFASHLSTRLSKISTALRESKQETKRKQLQMSLIIEECTLRANEARNALESASAGDSDVIRSKRERTFRRAEMRLEEAKARALVDWEEMERKKAHDIMQKAAEVYFESSTVVFCLRKGLEDMDIAAGDIEPLKDSQDPLSRAEQRVRAMKRCSHAFLDLSGAYESIAKLLRKNTVSFGSDDLNSISRVLETLRGLMEGCAGGYEEVSTLMREASAALGAQRKLLKGQLKTLRKDSENAQMTYDKALRKLRKLQGKEPGTKSLPWGRTVEQKVQETVLEVERAQRMVEDRAVGALGQRLGALEEQRAGTLRWALLSWSEARSGALQKEQKGLVALERVLRDSDANTEFQELLEEPKCSVPDKVRENHQRGWYTVYSYQLNGTVLLSSLLPKDIPQEIPSKDDDLISLASFASAASSTVPSELGTMIDAEEDEMGDEGFELLEECVGVLGKVEGGGELLLLSLSDMRVRHPQVYRSALQVVERGHFEQESETVAAAVMKECLRNRRHPIIPLTYRTQFVNIFRNQKEEERLSAFKRLLPNLPEGCQRILGLLIPFLSRQAAEATSVRVSSTALAKEFAPLILKMKGMEHAGGLGVGIGTLGRKGSAAAGGRSGAGIAVQAVARLINDSGKVFMDE